MFGMLSSCKREGVPKSGRTIFVRTQGADLPIYLRGNGNQEVVILVLHGGPGGNGLEYRGGIYAEMLEDKYTMAYLDQRGQGASRKVNGEFDITMAAMVRDLEAVVSVIKEELGENSKIYLFGHSWGGTLGTSYLLTRNNQSNVQGWIESDGAHDIPLLNKEAIAMFIQVGKEEIAKGRNTSKWNEIVGWAEKVDIDSISEADGGQINEYGYEAENMIDEIGASKEGGLPSRWLYSPVDPIISSMSGNSTQTALVRDGIERIALTNRLPELNIPTLLLWGKYDFVVPPALGESALNQISSTEKSLIMFDFSGHSPMNSEAEKFAQSIIDFVERTK